MFKDLPQSLLDSVNAILGKEPPKPEIAEADQEEYQKFFQGALDKFGVNSPAELSGDKEKEFYDYVDQNWKGSGEKAEQASEEMPPEEKKPEAMEQTVTYPHTMYDPNSGESIEVADEEEHAIYTEMGWVSEPKVTEAYDGYGEISKKSITFKNEKDLEKAGEDLKKSGIKYKRPFGGNTIVFDDNKVLYKAASKLGVTVRSGEYIKPKAPKDDAEKGEKDAGKKAPPGKLRVTNDTTLDNFDDTTQLLKVLKQDPEIKKHLGSNSLYFDDADLVVGDKTAFGSLISDDGWDPDITVADIKKKILATKADETDSGSKETDSEPAKSKKVTDDTTLDNFDDTTQLLKVLKQDPEIKKHLGKDNSIYFDGSDLVVGDKTAYGGLIDGGWDPDIKIADIKKKILATKTDDSSDEEEDGIDISKLSQNEIEMAGLDDDEIKRWQLEARLRGLDGDQWEDMYTVFGGDLEAAKADRKEESTHHINKSYNYLSEPAVSQSQQKLMAMALSYKRGEMKDSDASDQVKQLAKDMTEKELEDFASTKRSNLPVKAEADKAKMIPEAIDPTVGKKIVPLLKAEFKKISDAKSGTDDNQYSNMVLQDVNSLQNVYMKLWNATKTNDYTEALDDYSDLDTAVRDEVPMRLEMLIIDLMNQSMYESKKVLATEAVGDAFKELNTNVFQIQDRSVLSDVLRTADALARAIERDTQTSKGVVLKTLNGLMVKGKDIRSKEGEEIVDIKEFLPRGGKGGSIVAKLKSGKFITISLR